MSKADLRLDWCSYQAAKWAVEHWHYSHSMPTPPVIRVGVWESGRFIGCVLFSRGANNNLGNPYGLKVTEVCELTRVALDMHDTPVSRIVTIAVKMLKRKETGLRLIVSFADANEGHHGGIYQAGGWLYSGRSNSTPKYRTPSGDILHQRQVSKVGYKPQYGTMRRVPKSGDCEVIPQLDKYRYLYPLDPAMRAQIEPLRKPYPKRIPRGSGEIDNAADTNLQTGGASPTDPLLETSDGERMAAAFPGIEIERISEAVLTP